MTKELSHVHASTTAVIQGGLTKLLWYMDISVNLPIKLMIHNS